MHAVTKQRQKLQLSPIRSLWAVALVPVFGYFLIYCRPQCFPSTVGLDACSASDMRDMNGQW